jgi:hypothetical protein
VVLCWGITSPLVHGLWFPSQQQTSSYATRHAVAFATIVQARCATSAHPAGSQLCADQSDLTGASLFPPHCLTPTPPQVAPSYVFLASDDSSYITGERQGEWARCGWVLHVVSGCRQLLSACPAGCGMNQLQR